MLSKIVDNLPKTTGSGARFALVNVSVPHLGDFLRLRRDERGWTQDALARKSGISSATIYRAEQAAAKGEPVAPWKARFLIPVVAALHEKERLTDEQMTGAIIAAGIPEGDRRDVEHAIRKRAGEFNGLQERIRANPPGLSVLEELSGTPDIAMLQLQSRFNILARRLGVERCEVLMKALEAAFPREPVASPPIPLARVPLPPVATELVDRTPRPRAPKKR